MPKGLGDGSKGNKYSKKKGGKPIKNMFSSKKMAKGGKEVSPSHKGYAM